MLLVGVLIGSVLAVITPSSASAIGEPTFTNPLAPDTADPWLQYFEGNYYLAATTWSNVVTMRKSPTLAGLSTATPTTIWSDTTPGRRANMWAPDMHRLKGPDGVFHWYFMYTMGDNGGDFSQQHLQVLESVGDDPMGPYRYRGQPIPTTAWNIDGSYLQLNGQLYAIWSGFADDTGEQSNFIAKMSNPWTAVAPLTVLSRPTQPWERIGGAVNEGPVQLSHAGKEYIVYSASFCGTDDYQLGTLTWNGGDPLSPGSWAKSNGAVFSKGNGAFGPGHNSFFTSPDGTEIWNAYHANPRSGAGCSRERTTRAQKITFDAAGAPVFGTPTATSSQIAVPSGERGPLSPTIRGAQYQMVNVNSGLCAVATGTADNDDVVQGTCSTAGSATWVVDATADGWYRLVNTASHKSVDSTNCGTADGTDVRQFAWLANQCQQWRPTAAADGGLTFTNRANGKVLDVANCATSAGANIRQWRPLGNTCQQWSLRPVGSTSIVSATSGKSFDIANCATTSGAGLQQHQYLASPCQRYTFTGVGAFTEIRPSSAPTLCLGVVGASTADGATVAQGACGTAASSWRIEPMPDGSIRLVARHSGKVLDLADCRLDDGAPLRQWSDLGNQCQRFRIAS